MTQPRRLTTAEALGEVRELSAAGEHRVATKICQQIIGAQPACAEAHFLLGILTDEAGNTDQAIAHIEEAVKHDDGQLDYYRKLVDFYKKLKRQEDAAAAGRRIVELDPDDAFAWHDLGLMLTRIDDDDGAHDAFQRMIEIAPAHQKELADSASSLAAPGDQAGAQANFEKTENLNNLIAVAHQHVGIYAIHNGDIEGGRAAYDRALGINPNYLPVHFRYKFLKRYTHDDPHVALLEQMAEDRSSLSQSERIELCFTLGKMRNDIGRYPEAFAAYEEGQRLSYAKSGSDPFAQNVFAHKIKSVFTPSFLDNHRPSGKGGPTTPIFIVGMPRSGSTLTEQILASHAKVHGAGESPHMDAVLNANFDEDRPFPVSLANLDGPAFQAMGRDYLARLRAHDAEAGWITDKALNNYYYIGFIRLLLPEAKIIHCRRDPMDCCWSNFTNHFGANVMHSYDLETLGHYYNRYRDLMNHWHSVLPPNTVLDVDYVDTVADLEGQVRRILDYVGLPWDPACLEFHKTERTVKTTSLVQVRQPIYKTPVAPWRNYEQELAPLRKILDAGV